MSVTRPWYTILKQPRNVYHNNDRCTLGNNIEEKYRRSGTDSRPR